MLSLYKVSKAYLDECKYYNNQFANSKYTLCRMIEDHVCTCDIYKKIATVVFDELYQGLDQLKEKYVHFDAQYTGIAAKRLYQEKRPEQILSTEEYIDIIQSQKKKSKRKLQKHKIK